MKVKGLIALTAALSFGAAFAGASSQTPATNTAPATETKAAVCTAPFSDVPAGHWAKEAVDVLVQKGIIIGNPDGCYNGNANLTRYEAAVLIRRALDQLNAGNGSADSEVVAALQKAVEELSAELADLKAQGADVDALGVRVSDLEDNAVAKDDFEALSDRVVALEGASTGSDSEALAALDKRLSTVEAAVMNSNPGDTSPLKELQDAVEAAATAADTASAQAEEASQGQEALAAQIDDLAATVEDNSSSVASLNDLTVLLNQDVLALQDRLAELEAKVQSTTDGGTVVVDLTPVTDRLDAVEAGVSDVNGRVDDLDADVNDRIDSIEDIVSEKANASTVAALQATVSDHYDAISDLTVAVDENTEAVAALDDLTVLQGEDIVELQDSVAGLNDDITDLGGRLTLAETSIDDLNSDVDGINTVLNDYRIGVSGSLGYTYYVVRSNDIVNTLDIDRLWVNNSGKVLNPLFRNSSNGYVGTQFSTGKLTKKGGAASDAANTSADVDFADFGAALNGDSVAGNVTNLQNGTINVVDSRKEGFGTVSFSLNLSFAKRALSGKSVNVGKLAPDSQGMQVQNVAAEFGLKSGGVSQTNPAADTDYLSGLNFYVRNITSQFTVAGTPITFVVGNSPKFKFSSYVFDNSDAGRGAGYVATVDGSSLPVIGGFKPGLTVVYGSKGGANNDHLYYEGARGTLGLGPVTLGAGFAQEAESVAGGFVNANYNGVTELDLGVTGVPVLGNIAAEYSSTADGSTAAFVKATNGSLGPITIKQLDAAKIGAGWNGTKSISAYTGAYPYAVDTTTYGGVVGAQLGGVQLGAYGSLNANAAGTTTYNGFGAAVATQLGGIKLGAYGDSDSVAGTELGASAQFGVAGITVTPFFNLVSNAAGTVLDKVANDKDFTNNRFASDSLITITPRNRGTQQDTNAGFRVAGALNNINFDGGFVAKKAKFDDMIADLAADTVINAGIVTLEPSAKVSYEFGAGATNGAITTAQFLIPVSTAVLNAPLKPQFGAHVGAYTYSDKVLNAQELSWSVGAKLNEFLFPHSTLAASYASYAGNNRQYTSYTTLAANAAGSWSNAAVGATTLSGYYVEWNYNDLNFAYGDFSLAAPTVVRNQAFKIQYKVAF